MNSAPFHYLGNLGLSKKKVQNWLKHASVSAKANSHLLYILYFTSQFSYHIKSLFPSDLFGAYMPCLVSHTWTLEPDGRIWTRYLSPPFHVLGCHMVNSLLLLFRLTPVISFPLMQCGCIPLMSLSNQNRSSLLKRRFFLFFREALTPRMWSPCLWRESWVPPNSAMPCRGLFSSLDWGYILWTGPSASGFCSWGSRS